MLCCELWLHCVTLGTVLLPPVDVLKTKFMSDKAGRYASPLQCAVDSVREGGLRIFLKVGGEKRRRVNDV